MSLEENKENLLSLHLHHFTRKNKPLSPFVSKLKFLLNCTKLQHAIHWSFDGRSIVITDVETFKRSVLENEEEMFKTRNFTSFVRQLNLYGFRKVPSNGKSDPTTNMKFEHVHFRRARPDLMQFVHRTCLSGGGRRRAESPTPRPMTPEPRLLPKNATPVLYIKHENGESDGKKPKQTPLGISIIQNFKTSTACKSLPSPFKFHNVATPRLTISDTKVVSLQNILCTREQPTSPAKTSDLKSKEHDYALPTATSTTIKHTANQPNIPILNPANEMDDEQVYQFLDNTFHAELEVVQSLLSLPDSQPEPSRPGGLVNFNNLRTLAEVSLNNVDDICLRSQGFATPRETANPAKDQTRRP